MDPLIPTDSCDSLALDSIWHLGEVAVIEPIDRIAAVTNGYDHIATAITHFR